MKIYLLALALCAVAAPLFAQLPADVEKLTGTWQCRNCADETWSTWSYQPDGTLLNLTCALVGGDTVELCRLEVSQRKGKHTVMTLVQAGRPVEVFRLTRTGPHDLLWENENLASLSPDLHINFYGAKRMVMEGPAADAMDFRRRRHKEAAPAAFRLGEAVASR
ncbi:MAG TPA: hypothetical protein PK971_00400 [Saprospiraceae bacterium]|nr:hypothetical protein [Saprospiraceae bacterium]